MKRPALQNKRVGVSGSQGFRKNARLVYACPSESLIHDISFGSLTGFVVYLLIGNALSNAYLRDRRGILLATNRR